MNNTPDATSTYRSLRTSLRGRLLTPGETGYDEARALWNGRVDKHPDAIVQCAGTADVMTAVDFARTHDRPLSVKAGGHMTTGHAVCDDGIVVDLSPMNGIRVDPTAQTVRAQGGATWDQVNRETLPFHLLPPGIPLDVGVGGFTLGGGMGVVGRKHGLAVDNLREVDLVTARGDLVTAGPERHPDLFWAVRGGGGNFGVVTSFLFDCVEEPPECLTGQCIYSLDDAAAALRHMREAMGDLPEALFPILSLVSIPEMPGIPEESVGQPGLFVYVMCVGEAEEGADALDAFLHFGSPLVHVTNTVPYASLFDPFKIPNGERHHWESAYLDDLSDEFIDVLLQDAVPLPTPTTAVNIYGLGGAISRVSPDATAYAHRAHPYLCHVSTHWTDPADDARCRTWTRGVHQQSDGGHAEAGARGVRGALRSPCRDQGEVGPGKPLPQEPQRRAGSVTPFGRRGDERGQPAYRARLTPAATGERERRTPCGPTPARFGAGRRCAGSARRRSGGAA